MSPRRLDVCVLNAGIGERGDVFDPQNEGFQKTLDVDLTAVISGIRCGLAWRVACVVACVIIWRGVAWRGLAWRGVAFGIRCGMVWCVASDVAWRVACGQHSGWAVVSGRRP